MTGEITLRGRLLPVGGIKEKVMAAHRAGIKTLIFPKENEKNVRHDIPQPIQQELQFVFVDNIDQVLAVTLREMTELI